MRVRAGSSVTPVLIQDCVDPSSRKMWKSPLTTSHMLAHHEPSLNQRRLSALLVPVGSCVPLNDWSW